MKVATAVFHYNRDDLTNNLLQQFESVPNVFVFDDGSNPPFRNASLYQPIVRLAGENMGYVWQCNRAMRYFHRFYKFDCVLMANNDIGNVTGELVAVLERALDENPRLMAVSPAVAPSAHQEMRSGEFRPELFIDWVCPMVRLSAWLDVGGFDPEIRGYGCDLDICLRARRKGYEFAVDGAHMISHEMSATVRSVGDGGRGHADLKFMEDYLKGKYGVENVWDLKTL